MTAKSIRTIAFIVLLVHGIGHLQGVVTGLGFKMKKSSASYSWFFGKLLGKGLSRVLCFIFYLAAAILGICAALSFGGILLQHELWQSLALLTAIVSTAALIFFPKALAMFFNIAGAIAVNLLIYYSILFSAHWPSQVFNE